MVTDYFKNMNSESYLALMKGSFYLKIITLTAIALLFVFFILQTVSLYHLRNEARKSIPTHTETTIIYEND